MSPEDPRHGTYAGYEAHKKSKNPQCPACKTAGFRARKRMRMAGPALTELGTDAFKIVVAVPPSALSRATGLHPRTLHRLKVDGPTSMVRHETQRKILTARTVTPIGIARRLRALSALGWSATEVASRAGLTRWNVAIARSAEERNYVHAVFAEKIARVYDELAMTPAPSSRATTRQVKQARAKGWPPPLAFDNIDDPTEQPSDWAYRATDHRADSLIELDEAGVSIGEACRRLDVSRDALEKWCARRNLSDTFNRLAAREDGIRTYANQYGAGRVA